MARTIAPHPQALAAMDFIKEFNLCPAQVAYRYTVEHIDQMCSEIGLEPIEKEKEAAKTERLVAALHQTAPAVKAPAKKKAAAPAES